MTQITTGIRQLLSASSAYTLLADLLGSSQARAELMQHFIRPQNGQRILDLGCGPGIILDSLPRDIMYLGVDISQDYVDSAQKKYGHYADFRCCALEKLAVGELSGFDIVMGFGLLHHLERDEANHFFALAAAALKPSGRCLTLDSCRVNGQHPLARLLIAMDRGQNCRTAEGYAEIARESFPKVTYRITHNLLRLPYTHILMESRFL